MIPLLIGLGCLVVIAVCLACDRDNSHLIDAPPTEAFDDHVETALMHTSATPLFDELALERLRLALEDWGKEDVA